MSPGDVLRHNRQNNISKEDLLRKHNESMSRNGTSTAQHGSDWQAVVDPSSGDTYYYNSRTGQTQWESPFVSSAPAPTSSQTAPTSSQTVPTSSQKGSSDDWQAVVDKSSGDTYYYNKSTGKTQWEVPQGFVSADTKKSSSSHTKSSSSSKEKKKNLATFKVHDRVMYTKRQCAATVVAVHRDDAEGLYYTIRTEEDSREIQTIEKYMSPIQEEEAKEEEPELPQDVMEFVNVVQQYVLKQKDLNGGEPPKGYIESMVDVFLNAPPNGRETMLRDLRALVQGSGNDEKKSTPPVVETKKSSANQNKTSASVHSGGGGGLLSGAYNDSSSDDEG